MPPSGVAGSQIIHIHTSSNTGPGPQALETCWLSSSSSLSTFKKPTISENTSAEQGTGCHCPSEQLVRVTDEASEVRREVSAENTAEAGLEPQAPWGAQIPALHSSSAEPPTARGWHQGSRQAPGAQGFPPTSQGFSLEAEAPPWGGASLQQGDLTPASPNSVLLQCSGTHQD